MKLVKRFRGLALGALGVGALAASAPALPHHSFAMFDHDHQVKLTGTVHQFEWSNPHVYIEMDASDAGAPSNATRSSARAPGSSTESAGSST